MYSQHLMLWRVTINPWPLEGDSQNLTKLIMPLGNSSSLSSIWDLIYLWAVQLWYWWTFYRTVWLLPSIWWHFYLGWQYDTIYSASRRLQIWSIHHRSHLQIPTTIQMQWPLFFLWIDKPAIHKHRCSGTTSGTSLPPSQCKNDFIWPANHDQVFAIAIASLTVASVQCILDYPN